MLFVQGSPPLTRGILISTGLKIKVLRFTPAHAGNTKTAAVNAWRMAGSPPLTRGILISILQCQGVCRFTPAHAGNTFGQISSALALKVHPRSRGEYDTKAVLTAFYEGSPPLTRGIQECKRADYQRNRFTPAHAGNTNILR